MPKFSFCDALAAVGPAADLVTETALFGQFIGSWDVDVIYHDADGPRTRTGEWVFGWVLEGRAIQDVWRVPAFHDAQRTGAPLFGYGTTLRFYDAALGAWNSTWHGLVKGEVIAFIGRLVGEEIHLDETVGGVDRVRWAFCDIAPDRFKWRNEQTRDGGETWTLVQEMHARRRS